KSSPSISAVLYGQYYLLYSQINQAILRDAKQSAIAKKRECARCMHVLASISMRLDLPRGKGGLPPSQLYTKCKCSPGNGQVSTLWRRRDRGLADTMSASKEPARKRLMSQQRLFEMRTYQPAPGRMEALENR